MDVTELADCGGGWQVWDMRGLVDLLVPAAHRGQTSAQQRVSLLLQCKGRTEHVPKKQKGWKEALMASTAIELRVHCAESLHHALERRESHRTGLFSFLLKQNQDRKPRPEERALLKQVKLDEIGLRRGKKGSSLVFTTSSI